MSEDAKDAALDQLEFQEEMDDEHIAERDATITRLTEQIDQLAHYFTVNHPEAITGGGAVEVAIRFLNVLQARITELEAALKGKEGG